MTKASIQQGDIKKNLFYSSNNRISKYIEQKLTEQKRGINISINTLGDFNTFQKLMKEVYGKIDKKVEVNNTTNQFDLTFSIYSSNSLFFQVKMEHSSWATK